MKEYVKIVHKKSSIDYFLALVKKKLMNEASRNESKMFQDEASLKLKVLKSGVKHSQQVK